MENKLNFNSIYDRYYRRVYQSARHIIKDSFLAEDIVQETFIKAYKHIDKLKESEKIGAWLTTIATRTAIDALRKEKKKQTISFEDAIFTEKESWGFLLFVDREVDKWIVIDDMQEEITRLSPKLKVVFLLKYQKDLKDEEIASQLNISMSAVKTRLYRARKLMQEYVNVDKKEEHAMA